MEHCAQIVILGLIVMDIETVWDNIIKNEGAKFHTKSGIEFVYKIKGESNSIQPIPITNSNIFPITKKMLEDAMKFMPLKNTVPLQSKFVAPAYVYAILTDKRIV
jgi:Tfp pilus assembly pilus retraction ATPase PilT